MNAEAARRALAVLALVGVACGCGDDDGGAPSVDLTGWWQVLTRDSGTTSPYELVRIVNAAQTASTVSIDGIQYSLNGTLMTGADPSASDPDRTEFSVTVAQDSTTGTMTQYASGVVANVQDVQMYRTVAPSGAFTALGIVQTESVSVDTATGYARAYTLTGSVVYMQLMHSSPHETLELSIQPTTPPLSAQTYIVGSTVGVFVATAASEASATAGTVTIASLDSGQIVGSYDLTLSGGTPLVGNFDLDIEITREY